MDQDGKDTNQSQEDNGGKGTADQSQIPNREQLDAALAKLPEDYTDPDFVVNGMRQHWGDVFTDTDEAKVRELVKAPASVQQGTADQSTADDTIDSAVGKVPVASMRKYGWVPDKPDERDHVLPMAHHYHPLPEVIDLRHMMPPVYDQGDLGSCTANAIAAAFQYERRRQALPNDFEPSRLFVYYNEREMEGSVESDDGAAIRDGIKSVGKMGICPETEWPYDIAKFAATPPDACYENALKYKVVDYWRVPRDLTQMHGCLWAGFPIVFGFTVYQSFESDEVARTGLVPMPGGPDGTPEEDLGGHAVLAVGYDHTHQHFICRNSWGHGWGDKGYFYMPYAYLLDKDLSDDFWALKVVAG